MSSSTGTLPRQITADWLEHLRIPPEYYEELAACRDEECLLEVAVGFKSYTET